jgi:phosphoglycerate dehydrogenase-like enzyme
VGSVLFEPLVRSDVILTNSAGVYATAIADHAIGGILYFMRSFDVALEGQRQRRWLKDDLASERSTMREVSGSRVLIVGTGGIGSEIAVRLSAMGATCVGVRRRPGLGAPRGFGRVAGIESLDRELAGADVVVLASAATPETVGLLDRRRIALLGRGAIVVNVARGSLLDEAALCVALREGRIRGAFLDVFATEPLDRENPLWDQPGLFISPHVSGVSPAGFWRREMALFIENWRRYRQGAPLRNLVDKQAGY